MPKLDCYAPDCKETGSTPAKKSNKNRNSDHENSTEIFTENPELVVLLVPIDGLIQSIQESRATNKTKIIESNEQETTKAKKQKTSEPSEPRNTFHDVNTQTLVVEKIVNLNPTILLTRL